MHLLINLAENGHFGCDMKCPFCEWSRQDYGRYWFPSDEELDYALSISPKGLVLSGGGDPLYHYEKNRDKILHFIDYVMARGAYAGIYTHNLPVLWKYREELCALPIKFTFSFSRQLSPLEEKILHYYGERDKIIRISCVFNDDNIHEPNWDEINHFIEVCSPYAHIVFREHWICHYADRDWLHEKLRLIRRREVGFIGSDHPLGIRVMFEGKITTCGEIDQEVLNIKK